ncbi:trehalose-phosphatase [Nitratireductor sp. ZSWI3]|uniref:trehalose-phosphatase n=1 Tax=Nitratireductor sp. ZSWI3 TaxID=2966359 RepID=UPI00215004A6|nr:trehalose-phosphatase [Nitratireductor sp. ZSWI3]MCR4264669.1 trehalose-phosphatase [Nitratireductor sp. ZSWI3]
MTSHIERPSPHLVPPGMPDVSRTAFFFDFDGTLAEIVEDPAKACITRDVLADLEALLALSGGALAIVSGREVSDLDRRLAPLRPALAGVHGLEWRRPDGTTQRVRIAGKSLEAARDIVMAFAARHDGLLVETKWASLSLHYRQRPDLAAECEAMAGEIARRCKDISIVHGKMVIEFKAASRTKGDALAAFMAVEPFAGRRPLFAGDDATDEDGFASLDHQNGITIKIGPGDTCARYRLPDTTAFHRWLAQLVRAARDPA